MKDVFYSTKNLSVKQLTEIFKHAKILSDRIFIDEKDENYIRVPSIMSFENILKMLDKKCHCVLIERNIVYGEIEPFLEFGFCTMNGLYDHFLFIELSTDHLPYFIDKYKLVEL